MSLFAVSLVLALGASCATADYCNAGLPTLVEPPAGATLLQVLVLTRHGDRAPVNVYPNEGVRWDCAGLELISPATPEPQQALFSARQVFGAPAGPGLPRPMWEGNCTPGMLTTAGARQHMALGARMRSIYIEKLGLLPQMLSRDTRLHVRSTDVWRTRQSAMAHVAGLYPPGTMSPGARVDLHTAQYDLETMDPPSHSGLCPRLGQAIAQVKASPAWAARLQAMSDVRQRLEPVCGTAGLTHWSQSYDPYNDNLNCRACHGMPLPCSKDDARRVSEQAEWEYQQWTAGSDELVRLGIGFWFGGELVPAMQSAINGSPDASAYVIFSAHDSTVAFALAALGFRHEGWPPFAANMVFEVWKTADGEAAVRVQYNGEERVPQGCDASPCPWEQFSRMVDERIAVHNASKECALVR